MSIRAKHRWLAWLLPLFVLRAFVPVGFMLSWSGNDLTMMLCSGMGSVAVEQPGLQATGAAAHHHHEPQPSTQHHHEKNGGSQAHENSLCSFAVAGTASLPAAAHVHVPVLSPGGDRFDFLSDPALRATLISTNRIRGPPLS